MTISATPPLPANHLRCLNRRIASVRRKRSVVRTLTGIASAIALIAGAITVECLLDELVDLPWVARAFILLAILAASGWLLWRDSIQPFLKRAHDDAIALMIEHALPLFKTRFIASIQLARVFKKDQPALVRALLAETVATASRADFRKVVNTRRMRRSILTAISVIAIAGILNSYGGAASVLLIKRALLFNIRLPHKTQILKITGDAKIGASEDFHIDVIASGVLPGKGTAFVKTSTGDIREFDLKATPGARGQYSAVIKAPQESFSYHVKLNDDTSDTFRVTLMQRPAVVSVACDQFYPSYVKLPHTPRNVGDLTLLAGSKLKVTAKASIPVTKAAIRLAGLDKEIPMHIAPQSQVDLEGEFVVPAKGLTGFSLELVSTEGVRSANTATYRIEIVPDREPTVKVIRPGRREELAVGKANFLIAFEAKDDFGITKAELHYSVDGTEQKPVDFEIGALSETTVKRQFNWDLGKLPTPLVAGNVIEFWLSVEDTNTFTGPGVGTTEHYQIKIVGSEEKLQELANRRHDVVNGVGEMRTEQDDLNKDLRDFIFAKPK